VIEGVPLELTKIYPFRIGWAPDLHVGSQTGLWPEKWVTRLGQTIGPSPAQGILREYFYAGGKYKPFSEVCKENKVSILAMPGDLIAGKNPREGSKFLMTAELPEQVSAAAFLISEFCDRAETIEEVWIWKGTGYHESWDMAVGSAIASRLKAEYNITAKYFEEFSYLTLEYEGRKKELFITHHAGDAYMYPEQEAGKFMMMYQEAVAQGKLPPIDMVVRAHKHSFLEVHKPSIRSLQLPCWQFFVPYDNAMKRFGRYQPDIGGVVTLYDELLRTTNWHFIYPNIINPKRFLKANIFSDGPRGRPKCPICDTDSLISRGRSWQCKKCRKYFPKSKS